MKVLHYGILLMIPYDFIHTHIFLGVKERWLFKKAKQQKYFRIFFVIVILLVILKNQVK